MGAAAGEDLAIVTGHGDARLINLEQLGPYVNHMDVALLGVRPYDEYLGELRKLGTNVTTSAELAKAGPDWSAAQVLEAVTRATQGFWIHLDLDVLDARELPTVDSPEPDGLSFTLLTSLLQPLVASAHCVGLEVTIYAPDLDAEGRYAGPIVRCLEEACRAV
jgi:arginase